MASDIIGRDAELGAIDAFLDRLASGPQAIVIEGAPGIGKTTVWQRAAARCRERSVTVLSCHPVEAEAKLAFAALADLLEPVADDVLPHLPEPQRLALAIALMRETPKDGEQSARAVATATHSALRLLAAQTPTVLAIDDLQWLDRASAQALAFALRRIGTHRVGLLTAIRVEADRAIDPLALQQAFPRTLVRLDLGPLSMSALHHVIRGELAHVFPRPLLRRITDTSGGNPFFALELARALLETDSLPPPGEPLRVPDTVSSLVLRRLDRLPARARVALLIASALPDPTADLLHRVVGSRDADLAIVHAERARLIEVDGNRLRFVHPLVRSVVYGSVAPAQRREAHRSLAGIIAAPEERARHLALAAAEPDAEVARALDEAARLARRRGAPDAAAELQEQAARLTPPQDAPAGRQRRIQAAEHFFYAGARTRAREILEPLLTEPATGHERTTVLHLLGQICGQEDDFSTAMRHLEEALVHCSDPRTHVAIQLDLAFATYSSGDLQRAFTVACETFARAEQLGDPGLIASALAQLVLAKFMSGLGSDPAGMARALALEDRNRETQVLLRPTSLAGLLAVYEGRITTAEPLLRSICDWAKERGEESGIPFLLCNLSRIAWLRGDLDTARAQADEAALLAAQIGSDRMRVLATIHRGRALAMRGDVAGARADLAEARTLIATTAYVPGIPWLLASEGLLELSLGDLRAAERAFAPLVSVVEANGIREPMQTYYLPDAIETLIGVGELERASALLDPFAARARELERTWALANAVRCHSLLAAAHGDLDAALAHGVDAIERWEPLAIPLELGRALVTLGAVRRRRGERRAAREALARAGTIFALINAPTWAERAADELRRIPIRRSASADDLTPTEEHVATLAAAGRTNREVAHALHMSPKTVEANLTRVYDKLGIRSRAELGARMLERSQGRQAAKT